MENDALMDLFDNCNGKNWVRKDNWGNITRGCSNWSGVVYRNGIGITELNLVSNNLKGTIPISIGNLVNLTVLQLMSIRRLRRQLVSEDEPAIAQVCVFAF